MSRFTNPIPQYVLEDGDLAVGGTLTFYESGTNTLLNIFADDVETLPIANPVVLGSRGAVPNIFFSQTARVLLQDANGVEIFDVDPVDTGSGGAGSAFSLWSSATTYDTGDLVYGSNGLPYVSIASDNLGSDPTFNANNNAFWSQVVLLNQWNALDIYRLNDLVVIDGGVYVSQISDNTNNDPTTDTANWLSISDASLVVFDNVVSGLTAVTAEGALNELVVLINSLPDALTYRGQLDVATGDSALPVSPTNGDLYVISTGGTITVSVNGGSASATAVTEGQQIVWNDASSRWDLNTPVTQAASVAYSNLVSMLAAFDVQTAIDVLDGMVDANIVNIANLSAAIAGLGDGVTYKGQLDVSTGDSALPLGATAGDLYIISTGGTITVASNGGAPTATVVVAGEQIIFNGDTSGWDLVATIFQAVEIGYDNTVSGLNALDVQSAIDEIVVDVDANTALISALESAVYDTANATATVTRTSVLTDLTKTNTDTITLTLDDATFENDDLVIIRKCQQGGLLTVNTTNNQVLPDGTTAISNFFADGTAGTVELKYNGSVWTLRIL